MEGYEEKALNKSIKATLPLRDTALIFELFGSDYVLDSR